jgi:hypothetical protein
MKYFNNVNISNSNYQTKYDKNAIYVGRINMSRGITYPYLSGAYFKIEKNKFDPGVILQASR